jgi:hypothetical protein
VKARQIVASLDSTVTEAALAVAKQKGIQQRRNGEWR